MNVTWLISRTSPALSRAMARAKVRHRASSVERSCSPTSQTMIGLASVSFRLEVGRSETVKKEDPRRAMALLPQAVRKGRVTRVWSTAPDQLMPARHVGAFVVSP